VFSKEKKKPANKTIRSMGSCWLHSLFWDCWVPGIVMNSIMEKHYFPQGSASLEGEKIDQMLYITIAITGVVFVITQVLLFWFAFKYQEQEGRKALLLPAQ
jgi:heme/copper-type cytochrome/quinol oxidase subunit 2